MGRAQVFKGHPTSTAAPLGPPSHSPVRGWPGFREKMSLGPTQGISDSQSSRAHLLPSILTTHPSLMQFRGTGDPTKSAWGPGRKKKTFLVALTQLPLRAWRPGDRQIHRVYWHLSLDAYLTCITYSIAQCPVDIRGRICGDEVLEAWFLVTQWGECPRSGGHERDAAEAP